MGQEEERIRQGILFFPGDPELKAIKRKAHDLNLAYNKLYEDQEEEKQAILRELLGEMGEDCFMQGPITFHYGTHTKIGSHVFVNFNFTVQDDAEVVIGDHCDFGPNVTIATPIHPMLAEERVGILDRNGESKRLCYGRPVHIGNRCWICAGAVICGGVTIGDDCVIGAGSVVTRDIPAGCFAAGNPCRVIRKLTDADSLRHRPEVLADCRIIQP